MQRIQIGAQADAALTGFAPVQRGDNPGLGDALCYRQPPCAQPFGDQRGGAGFLKPDLGMPVDVLTDGDQFRFIRLQCIQQIIRHVRFPVLIAPSL